MFRKDQLFLRQPKKVFWRLFIFNVAVTTLFIAFSSGTIYYTACFLVDRISGTESAQQLQFDADLFSYLLPISIGAISGGTVLHYVFTRRILSPLRDLIASTKKMKQGEYPPPLIVKSEDEMGELIVQFNEMVQQLKDTKERHEKKVSDLSHEFRTPLANLSGYLKALKSGVITGDQQLYESLYDESQRLIRMVEQLEQLKEWYEAPMSTLSRTVDNEMRSLIHQSVAMFRLSSAENNCTIDVSADEGYVMERNGGLSQVLYNLLDNAIQHYEGVGAIVVQGEKIDGAYRVSVSGPGKPIPPEASSAVFERFYRVDASREGKTGGAGLGLAISKEIVERHEGEIGMSSNNGYHTFWFTVPVNH
ncbi:HAMP domain-containing histidine kinase [Bacillaceae bacterium SIJ1]|uniref:sensor histidine kinase n=1 Tax=Litoribacterium kuwaitense TaxID=1398745 RepID=UPI0013EAB377|nr:HAMP domain-containing sensor histidine kinase [Litoribacterium kuwaitense]NGP45591.1 HAMP domain-containing histidine kinase [Litoribacterium kuwaitense]